MKRLTKRNQYGEVYYPKCFEKCDGAGSRSDCDICEVNKAICKKLAAYEDFIEQGKVQLMDCTGCIHKGNREFCLNCRRGGCRDYFLTE